MCNGPNEALSNEFDPCVAIPKCKNLVFIYPLFIKKHITYFSVVLCPKGLILRHLILCIQHHELRIKQNNTVCLTKDSFQYDFCNNAQARWKYHGDPVDKSSTDVNSISITYYNKRIYMKFLSFLRHSLNYSKIIVK